jgi:hypothetical protein
VKALTGLVVVISVVLCFTAVAQSPENLHQPAEESAASAESATAQKCLRASVNPVTGHAICLEPRGAPVDPPAPEAFVRPCKPRAHDNEDFTMYERYSGC